MSTVRSFRTYIEVVCPTHNVLRINMDWWDAQRQTHAVSAEDLKYMNRICVDRLICPRVLYVLSTPRALGILASLEK